MVGSVVPSRWWSLLAVVAAVVTGMIVALGPMATTSSCVATSSGTASCSTSSTSLLTNEGASILALVAIPVVVTLVPLLWPSRRTIKGTAILLTMATVVGIMSVGIFLVPTVICAWLAARAANHEVAAAP